MPAEEKQKIQIIINELHRSKIYFPESHKTYNSNTSNKASFVTCSLHVDLT